MRSDASRRASSSAETIRNTDHLKRIRYRLGLYTRQIWKGLGHVPVKELIRTQFPFLLTDAPVPPMISVELTNHCNLRCGYCTNPTSLRPRGMMGETTFARSLDEIRAGEVYFVALCGNGEPTLHPRFPEYVSRLSQVAPYLSVTSNWQRIDDEIATAVLKGVRELNISVDGFTEAVYERRRPGSSFPRLLDNLRRLRELQWTTRSRALINIRVMIATTDRESEQDILNFWRPYANVVSRQRILDFGAGVNGSFIPIREGRCTLTLRKLDVHWNGVVNLCGYSWMQTGEPEGVVLGNIEQTSLSAMWNSALMEQYREGHRTRREELIPVCRGCPGRT